MSHYILRVMSWFRLVWDIQLHPKELYEEAKTGIVRKEVTA